MAESGDLDRKLPGRLQSYCRFLTWSNCLLICRENPVDKWVHPGSLPTAKINGILDRRTTLVTASLAMRTSRNIGQKSRPGGVSSILQPRTNGRVL